MRLVRTLLLFVLTALSLGALGAPAIAAEATTGTIAGTVRTAAGAPFSGARVSAASPSGRASATTDARGTFTLLGLAPDTYTVSAEATGFEAATVRVTVLAGESQRATFALTKLTTIASVRATSSAFSRGSTADTFAVSGDEARALAPTTSAAGLANYTQGTVQGAIAQVPGVDLDAFANAILRGGKVGDAVFDYDSIPIPQGLIAEPGGNIDGAQLPTTGVATTTTTLAGYTSEGDNALGGVIDQIAAIGTYPARIDTELGLGAGVRNQSANLEYRGGSPDLRWRYAFAGRSDSEYLPYGDGQSFYPSEAATYGIALQDRSENSLEGNVHYRATSKDDVSFLLLAGGAKYDQYDSPYAGETYSGPYPGTNYPPGVGELGAYPGVTDQEAPVNFASAIKGSFDAFKLEWLHTGAHLLSRVQLYDSEFGASSGGPFWDENGFPDGAISLFETSAERQVGLNYDGTGSFGRNEVKFGAEYRSNSSLLNQIVPTGFEFITSHPNVQSTLGYLSDSYAASDRLQLTGTARVSAATIKPSYGSAYDDGAIDPHAGLSYKLGSSYALRATFDHTTVAPAPLEADRVDSTNTTATGALAPFVPLASQTANDFTYSFETTGRVQFRATYYQEFEKNLIDVLPFNFRSALAAGTNPNGVGVPTNVGDLRAKGFEVNVRTGGFRLNANFVRAFSSSASQFAYNDLNAPAVTAGHLFPVSYEPDLTTEIGYEFDSPNHRIRITPSLSYETGYPYGNGRDVYIFNPVTNKPQLVPNDNYYNPGYNYYFLQDPSMPHSATNPYIGNLGTPEGADPNTLRAMPQVLANLHGEADLSKGVTLVVDVTNLFGEFSPTAYQGNPWLIGPPGYAGGNALYSAAYAGVTGYPTYTLGNGVPTNDGVHAVVPWTYGRAGYVPQSYPTGRTVQLRLKFRT